MYAFSHMTSLPYTTLSSFDLYIVLTAADALLNAGTILYTSPFKQASSGQGD